MNGVQSFPVAVFRDGFGKDRPAQVGACSVSEMRDALQSADAAGLSDFVIVSHNFEMLKPGTSQPDSIVVRRFEHLCALLAEHRAEWPVTAYRATENEPLALGLTPAKEAAGPRAWSVVHADPLRRANRAARFLKRAERRQTQ